MKLNNKQIEYINNKLNSLSKSKFRSSFHLRKYMIDYINEKGLDKIEEHTREIIINAQHACACCCRGCLEKWHKIPKGKKLEEREINYITALLMEWIKREYNK